MCGAVKPGWLGLAGSRPQKHAEQSHWRTFFDESVSMSPEDEPALSAIHEQKEYSPVESMPESHTESFSYHSHVWPSRNGWVEPR